MSKRNPFYNKIIDEWKVAAFFDNYPFDVFKPFRRWFFFMVFSAVPPCLATIFGYYFGDVVVIVNFGFIILFFGLSVLCGIRYCQIMIEHSIPRKKRYPIIFVSVQLLLMGACAIVPLWTTRFEYTPSGIFIHINALPAYLAVVLTIIMVFVHYYSVTNCFKKYYKEKATTKRL